MYHNGRLVWYAVLRDNDDTDYGYGSYNKKTALKMLRTQKNDGYTDAHIAIIDPTDGYCIDVIKDNK